MPRFSKYTGAGNDFAIVRAEEVGLDDASALARRICSRATGAGVDGLILVRSLSEEHVRLRFFNPDGSEFGTCGNGTRCAARYAVDRGLVEAERFQLVTDDGEIDAVVDAETVAVDYRLDSSVERELEVEVGDAMRRGWLVQMGTPHFVLPLETMPEDGFEDLARPIRSHPSFAEGANVDFVSFEGPDSVIIRTFERGVEGETQACGSGAMAAALALREAGLGGSSLSLLTRSGETLTVRLMPAEGRIRLAGPARHVFDGVLPDERPTDEG